MGLLLAALLAVSQTGHPDIYSIDLVPTPDLRNVTATAHLGWARTPFGIAVSADGHHRYQLSLFIEGLPDPASLGDYTAYVAWVTTPLMSPLIKLGEVSNGNNTDLGVVELNQFVVLVSAEASGEAAVERREGRLVLRGRSPSMRIQPDNHLMLPPVAATAMGDDAWPHPPMHPLVAMIPGLEDLKPGVKPFLPRADRGEDVAPHGRVKWCGSRTARRSISRQLPSAGRSTDTPTSCTGSTASIRVRSSTWRKRARSP